MIYRIRQTSTGVIVLETHDHAHAQEMLDRMGGAGFEIEVAVTDQDIKAEAQRRIIARSGATTLEGSIIKQLNAQMRALELTRAEMTRELNAAEQAEAADLQALADDIKAIRAREGELQVTKPVDFDDNANWP